MDVLIEKNRFNGTDTQYVTEIMTLQGRTALTTTRYQEEHIGYTHRGQKNWKVFFIKKQDIWAPVISNYTNVSTLWGSEENNEKKQVFFWNIWKHLKNFHSRYNQLIIENKFLEPHNGNNFSPKLALY